MNVLSFEFLLLWKDLFSKSCKETLLLVMFFKISFISCNNTSQDEAKVIYICGNNVCHECTRVCYNEHACMKVCCCCMGYLHL